MESTTPTSLVRNELLHRGSSGTKLHHFLGVPGAKSACKHPELTIANGNFLYHIEHATLLSVDDLLASDTSHDELGSG
jgi:hypothetical protein